jgi:uracil-DNA glycosylase family 4
MDYNTKNFLCTRCGLFKQCIHPHLNGRGNPNAKILVLGEAPGKDEDMANTPFIGSSGSLLQNYLTKLNIDCYIDNSVSCRPSNSDGSNRTPSPLEIECCRAFTMETVLKIKPTVIIAVGKIATVQLLKLGISIEVARGQKFYIPELNTTVIPTYHPAYLIRQQDNQLLNEFISDLELAKKISELPQARTIKSKPITLKDPVKIKNYLTELIKAPSVALDIETTGLNHREDRITDISFCKAIGEGVHIKWSDLLEFNDLFSEFLITDNEKILHNAHFDLMFLRQCGYKVNKKIFDTMLAFHMLNMKAEGGAGNSLFALDTMSWLLTTEGGYKSILNKYGGIKAYQDALIEEEEEGEKDSQMELFNSADYTVLDKDAITEYDKYLVGIRDYLATTKEAKLKEFELTPGEYYSAMDSDVTYRIAKNLKTIIDKNNSELYYGIIMPLCRSLVEVRLTGIKLDFNYIDKIKVENDIEIEKIKTKFFTKIGYEFNLNSSKEIGNLMYNKLGLIPNKKFTTKKGKKPAANEAAIEFYMKQKPILKGILEYRELQKQNSTYLIGLKKQADKKTHRYYPEYKQLTVTGRLSSAIHTIPKDNKIRGIIIPEKGSKLVLADLSQIELRMLAFLSGDENMINAFESGHDFHTRTACEFNNINIKDFDKENPKHSEARSAAKCVDPDSLLIYNNKINRIGNLIDINQQNDTFVKKDGIIWNGEENIEIKSNYKNNNDKKILIVSKRNVIVCSLNHKIQLKNNIIKKASDITTEDVLYEAPIINTKELLETNPVKLKFNPFFDDVGATDFELTLDERWAYIAGIFTGDGCWGGKYISISTGAGTDNYDIWRETISNAFLDVGIKTIKKEYKRGKNGSSYSASIYIGSTKIRRFFNFLELATPTSKTFKIPLWIFNGGKKVMENFIGGLIDTDGTISPISMTSITTKHWTLLQDLTVLLKILDYPYSINCSWNKKYKKMYYTINLQAEAIKKLHLANVIKCSWKKENLEKRYLTHINTLKTKKVFVKNYENTVRWIDTIETGKLVDIEVKSKDHLYWLNGLLVHNSINFGIAYLISAESLAEDLNISVQKAQLFMNKFFTAYPKVSSWINETIEFARQFGYVETLYGRRRYLPKINSSNEFSRAEAERRAVNTRVQGCLEGSMHILIKNRGYIKIKDVVNEKVELWDGDKYVSAFIASSGLKQKVEVIFWGNKKIICSPDHKFLTINTKGKESFKTVKKMSEQTNIRVRFSKKENNGFKSNSFLREKITTHWKAPNGIANTSLYSIEDIKDDYEKGIFLGRVVSDGSISNKFVYLLVAEHEKNICSIIENIIPFKYSKQIIKRPNKQTIFRYTISSVLLGRQLCNYNFKQKIPDICFQNKELLRGFLVGMFDGDGTIGYKNNITLTFGKIHFYEEYARDIQRALEIFGIRSRLHFCSDRINVRVLKRDSIKFKNEIGFLNFKKTRRFSKNTGKIKDGVIGESLSIKDIKFYNEEIEMFDVINSDSGKFMCEGVITHNSSGDITNMAVIKLTNWLEDAQKKSMVVATIHDSIMTECPETEIYDTSQQMVSFLTKDVPKITIKLKADLDIQDRWQK